MLAIIISNLPSTLFERFEILGKLVEIHKFYASLTGINEGGGLSLLKINTVQRRSAENHVLPCIMLLLLRPPFICTELCFSHFKTPRYHRLKLTYKLTVTYK